MANYPAGPKVSLDFKNLDDFNLIGFSNSTKTAITASTWYTHPKITMTIIGSQTTDFETIVETIKDGNKGKSNTIIRDTKRNALITSLVANAKDIETTALQIASGDILAAEQLILTTGYLIAGKPSHKPRDFGIVETGVGWAHIRSVKTQTSKEIVNWEYGITQKKDIPPATTTRHTFDKVDIIITDLPSGAVCGIRKAGSELAGKIKKYEHPTISHISGENLEWSDWIYFVVP
jgi:hypothetical protein